MDKYAIIKSGGHQFLVTEGQTLTVNKLVTAENQKPEKELTKINFDQILLVKDGSKLEIGKPLVTGIVGAEILGAQKGKKIRVSKFKAKTGYRKTIGFRSILTKVKINNISLGKDKEAEGKSKE